MAEIGKLIHTPPVARTAQTKVRFSAKNKEQSTQQDSNKNNEDHDEDDKHIDEYA